MAWYVYIFLVYDLYHIMHPQLIAFDLFDTCITIPDINRAYISLFADAKISSQQKEIRNLLLTSSDSLEHILARFHIYPSSEQLSHFALAVSDEIRSVLIFPETIPVLSSLRDDGYSLALVSNLSAPYIQALDKTLPHMFDYEVLSCNVWATKPHVPIFDSLKKISWYNFEDMIMVGNSLSSDVQWAKNAGMSPVHLDRNSAATIYHKDYVSIPTLYQLIEILRV